ncbi:aquaporin-like [Phlebotomus argentipes]|uniref:aquaporin-like n=1 Tax=Phlebotomus argentipes TaxID=94469 RepID=UPI00289338B1|nr:aquaporin-like [Phlebotomus argentipes]
MASVKWGFEEISAHKRPKLLRALLAEFLGIFMLNLFGCIAATCGDPAVISIAFGFEVFMIISALGHVSGSHINPAVTVGFLVSGQVTLVRAVLYVVVQCVGAVAGTACMKAFLPESEHGELCHLYLDPSISVLRGVFIECSVTFLLMLTVLGVSDENKSESKFSAALTVGLVVVLGNLSAIKFTGASMNPGRYFGSAVIAGSWENHWVYWAGPLLGAIAASLLYVHLFRAPPRSRENEQGHDL